MGFEDLINNAKDGNLVLHMDDEAFSKLITACDVYIDELKDLHRKAMALADKPLGFSEDHLDSGAQLARIFQEKAGATQNSAAATFLSHVEQVEEMKTLFLATRTGFREMEANNARKFAPGNGR
ncbi:hypothetical protein BKG86_17305 [Mycobacteroides chelonae]|uniref:hypothetical protein n=1 Tax=Mycobacteroides chelonae TaxID=1774 RepID=UPI0008AA43DE|nr:hypothetical protein [Mycobacteroides chelonae]OHU71409.1 hypothetical protein BKG86_17305 [Mycobacteroides chelonae]